MLRHREGPKSENVIAWAKSLADPWHDGESFHKKLEQRTKRNWTRSSASLGILSFKICYSERISNNVNNDLPENPLDDWNEEQMSQCQMRRRDSTERTSDRRTSGQQYAPDGPESWNKGIRRRSAGNSQKFRDSDAGKVSGRDRERSYGGSGSQIRKMMEEDEEDYRRDMKPANGYTNFEERTRSYKIEEDAQMLNEEEEGFLRTRDPRDM
ncbi:hypothetical protein R1sor_013645 [Riccia sorocarpa]|uniref:Uncharacterized protein n=1 Tax=Riccia sorocarpa TaxID=122646 RepID=A0ABD3H920_9MARC